MMDCDTTGIEPDLALVKYKKLVGGGVIKIVNNTVPQALMRLGYTPEETSKSFPISTATAKSKARRTSSPSICRFSIARWPLGGGRSIAWRGHLNMMAAAQPFLSGAISKTINMPEESTVEDIMQAYIESWKLGVKAVAIYRDNSKGRQPLSAAAGKTTRKEAAAAQRPRQPPAAAAGTLRGALRRKLPDERKSITHKFSSAAMKATSPWACTKTARARRNFHQDGQGRLDAFRRDGWLRAFRLHRLAVWRAAQGAGRQADQHAFRAFGLHGQSGHPLRQLGAGLHRALARRRFISADYLKNGERR